MVIATLFFAPPPPTYERVSILSSAAYAAREPVVPKGLTELEAEKAYRGKGYQELTPRLPNRLVLLSPDLYDPVAMKNSLEVRRVLAKALEQGRLIDTAKDPLAADVFQRVLGDTMSVDVRGSLIGVETECILQVESGGQTMNLGVGTSITKGDMAKMEARMAKRSPSKPSSAGSWFPPRLAELEFRSYTRSRSNRLRNEEFFRIQMRLQEVYVTYEDELETVDRSVSKSPKDAGFEDFDSSALRPGRLLMDLSEPERSKVRDQFRGQFATQEEADAGWGKARVQGGQRRILLSVKTGPMTSVGIGLPR